MNIDIDIVTELESRAAELGLTIDDLCARAHVARSTFVRWKAKTNDPNLGTYFKLRKVLDKEQKRRERVCATGAT